MQTTVAKTCKTILTGSVVTFLWITLATPALAQRTSLSDLQADVDQNTSDIGINAAEISTNAADIANNAADIANTAADTATNSADINETMDAVCTVAIAAGVCDDIAFCSGQCPKTVFATSTTFDGNLGGLTGADASCQSLADAAGLSGTYKAWLSDSTTNVRDRFTQATGPYVRVDGARIADDWADLTNNPTVSPLQANINVDETGSTVSAQVWTGSTFNGGSFGLDCLDWSSNNSADRARSGNVNRTDLGWTSIASPTCNTANRLYCFQQ